MMQGKVAVITASSTGIGKAIATRLAQEGAKVIISSRNIDHINEAVKQLKDKGYQAHGIVCHVGKKQDRQRLINGAIQKYGRIDYLVPNAAVSIRMKDYLSAKQQQLQKMFEINYKSTYLLIQQCLPYLRKQKGSSIVIISTYASYKMTLQATHYAITKLMLNAMTKILSRVLIPEEIRVNCVCPGIIISEFSKYIWEDEKYAEEMRNVIGIKRFGKVEEISGVVKFLLSDEASYVNGECMVVAGHPSARL